MRAWLLLAVLYLVSVLAAYVAGLNNGQASTQRDNARADLQAVEGVLQRSQAQTEQANKTSQDLLVQMQNRVSPPYSLALTNNKEGERFIL